MLSIVMLSVGTLRVVMLSAIYAECRK
jgi:hypothetical protein